MSQSSDKEKSLNDQIEEGLSSFIDKTREVTNNLVDQAKDATSGLVSDVKSIVPGVGENENEEGFNNPNPNPNPNQEVNKEITELDNPVEAKGGEGESNENEGEVKVVEEVEEEPAESVTLELGDIIYIIDPTNEILNDNTFIIEYIDPTKIKLVNIKSFEKTQLNIGAQGVIGEGTIQEIKILSRNSDKGFARQNGLLPGKWVNIYFGGEYPAVITGEITNLEEDMIELRTTDEDTIYINFEYQGIPERLPIETFELRPAPTEAQPKVEVEAQMNIEEGEQEQEGEEGQMNIEVGEVIKTIPKNTIKEKVKQFIIEGDQFFLGDAVKVQEYVNIDKDKYRFNIETQTNDLLEEMVSTIPNTKRTPNVLNNIHVMITRFIELRNQSSTFDVNNNIVGLIKKTADDRPLAEYLSKFQNTLYWILLVAKNIKKVYPKDEKSMSEDINDIQYVDMDKDLNELSTLFKNYRANVVSEGQNKYAELYNSVNPFLTPFLNDSLAEPIQGEIVTGNINSNINAIIDNLGDLYSTVVANDSEATRKFVLQRYCLGLDRLDATNLKGSKMIAHRVKLTPNDTIKIKSVLTLPEPTVRFSQINLPGSNLLVKSNLNLHFINYWQLLKQKTAISNIDVNSLDDMIQYEDDNFVDSIKNYILDFSENDRPYGLSDTDVYNEFLKIIIPKTRVLFNLVKKYIKGRLSMVDLINYLEPFLIYSNDLTFMQYIEFNKFIQSKIKEYNSNFVEYSRAFAAIKNMNIKTSYKNPLFSLLNNNPEINDIVYGTYGLKDPVKALTMTTSEFLKKVKLDDFGNVFNIGVAFSNLQLMYPSELKTIFEADKDTIKARIDKNMSEDTCTSYIIAKKYYSKDRLDIDNGQIIYFDKDFDTTNYDIIDVDYKKERDTLTAEELTLYLTEQLQKKYKKNLETASYMADTLVNRAKRVRDGHYAILAKSDTAANEPTGLEYYIRKDNQWVLVPDVNPEWFIKDEDILCNIQTDCLFKTNKTDETCQSVEVARETMVSNALKEILDQFDKNYQISKEEFDAKIQAKAKYYDQIYNRIQDIKERAFLQYNKQKYEIGLTVLEEVNAQIVSPYAKLRDLIMSQNDFVKKQNDIIQFALKFCRAGNSKVPNINDGEMENEWWLYCKETNVKLLPLFRYKLAKVFVTDPDNYHTVLNELIKEIGKIGSNGDAWTDVNSGEIICYIDSDVDEGYKDGFKVKSREVMEEEESSQAISKPSIGANTNMANKIKLSPEGQLISNVINGLAANMGINIDNSSSFIIKVVTDLMNDSKVIYKESAYREKEKKAAKEGKKIPEYGAVYSSTLLFLTLGMFLIGVQTNIPSLKTRKTFPGCVRSFSGFPIEGEGDDSGINYLACVAFKMKSKVMPWDALARVKEEKLADTIKIFTVRYLLPYPEVEQKIREKVEYLLTNPEKDIPDEHDLSKWTTFLPPLQRFHIKGLQNVTDGFTEEFEREIKLGSNKQLEKLLVIESKIIAFSLAMQEEIQKIVEKKDLLLRSSVNPFMDNACCNEKENANKTTLEYFVNDNANIGIYNNVVKELSAVLQDIKILTQGSIMLSTVDTKRIFPEIPENFSEETIYRAFIDLCRFQSTVPIDPDLATICIDKPDYLTKNDTLQEKIAKLKRDGRNFNKESFLKLFQIVSRNNIIRISLVDNPYSYSDSLRKQLLTMDNEDDNIVSRGFRQKLETLLDTYDISLQEDTEEMRQMKNYLSHANDMMRKDIVDFIKRKAKVGAGELRRITSFLKDLTAWDSDLKPRNKHIKISDDAMYNYINFYKTFISLLTGVIPTMILNKQTQTINCPTYWGLSQQHAMDLKNIVEDYYEPLKKFYGNKAITNILYEIQSRCRNLVLLSETTPALTNIQIDRTGEAASEGPLETYSVFDKRTATLLFEYYMLQVFVEYINLTKDPKMVSRMLITPESETDTIYSADFLIEQQLRFSESEQQFIEGDVVKLQETVAKLLVAYITMMMNSKDTIDMSYDTVMDRVFKLKENEKYTFTDRLQNLTEEERAVDTILKINKLGVWSKGLTKGIKEYDPENYDQEKQMTEKIAAIEKSVRSKNANVTDRNMEMFFEDALDEMDTEDFVNRDEIMMADINEDNNDGDPFGDERDHDYDNDYN
jgi:RNase H-fold protein (predicted Holliday junction resolvase)